LFKDASHMPPTLSQSALEVIFEKSLAPDGLAEGELGEPLDEPPVAPGDVVVPLPDEDGGLDGELPDFGSLPLGLVWAAANAGARAMIATKSTNITFCIGSSSWLSQLTSRPFSWDPPSGSNIRAREPCRGRVREGL